MLTSYTRIIIVLHFLRTAIGTQTAPPNQVLIALALFLTFFIMWPTFQQINTEAIQPLDKGEITTEEAFTVAQGPIREFMYGQTQEKDLKLFVDISDETYDSYDDVPMTTLIPAFILSELRAAFIIGFVIYIPFIVIEDVYKRQASMDPDSITTFDGDNSEGGVTRAAEDSTNGLTISYNNDGEMCIRDSPQGHCFGTPYHAGEEPDFCTGSNHTGNHRRCAG